MTSSAGRSNGRALFDKKLALWAFKEKMSLRQVKLMNACAQLKLSKRIVAFKLEECCNASIFWDKLAVADCKA